MRRTWSGLGLVGAVLLSVTGCVTTDDRIKPPTRPEEYVLPPTDDPRFSSYPAFPEKTLNQGLIKKNRDPNESFQRPPSRLGSPGGFGSTGPGGY